jgi:hypothetical protein
VISTPLAKLRNQACKKYEFWVGIPAIIVNEARGIRSHARVHYGEAAVGVTVLAIGVACTVGTLTKLNSIASTARSATGVYTAVMNQIDLIQSNSPFNPQKTNPDGTAQIPPELQLGTQAKSNVPDYYQV